MKKTIKVLFVLIILASIFGTTNSVMAALNSSGVSPDSYKGDAGYSTTSIDTIGNQIIRIVSTIGSIAAVIVLVVLGIKYMMGSAEEKAEYKKTMIPYIVGAILIFASTTIVNVVYNMANAFNK